LIIYSGDGDSRISYIAYGVEEAYRSCEVSREEFLPLEGKSSLRSAGDDSRCRSSWNASRFAQGERCEDISRGERGRGVGQYRGKWWRLVDSVYGCGRLSGVTGGVGVGERKAAIIYEEVIGASCVIAYGYVRLIEADTCDNISAGCSGSGVAYGCKDWRLVYSRDGNARTSGISYEVGEADGFGRVGGEGFGSLGREASLRSACNDSDRRSSCRKNGRGFIGEERCHYVLVGYLVRGIGDNYCLWCGFVDSINDGSFSALIACEVAIGEGVAAVAGEGTSTAARTPVHFTSTSLARGKGGVGNCHSGFVEAD
jgi:hypothetical protein